MRCENKTFLQNDPGFLQEISSTAVEVGLGAGRLAHSAAMAGLRPGLRPILRGSSVPLSAGRIVPIRGSLSLQGAEHAAGSSVGVGFRLKARTTPPASRNFRIPALRA